MYCLKFCLLLALICLCQAESEYDNIMKSLNTLMEAIGSQKAELLSNFEEMKTHMNEEIGEMINEAKTEFTAMNTRTRNDLSNLQHLLDSDECTELTHNCSADAVCTDTRVSYKCTCKPGFTGDGFTCEDIDECNVEGRCHPTADCVNIPGNYSCQCKPGFRTVNETCEDIDECSEELHNCHTYAICTNTPGSYDCRCTLYHEGNGIHCREVEMEGCDPPFKAVKGIGCIHIIERSQTFSRSRSSCKDLGGDLFVAVNKDHYLRLAQYFIDSNQQAIKKYMWVGVEEGVWLSGRKVAPEEEAPGKSSKGTGRCSYTDGDTSEKFLLWTDPCSYDWWALCEKAVNH